MLRRALGAFLLASFMPVYAQQLPNSAATLIPQLKQEIEDYWPDQFPRTFIPALIEQESNWKLNARLKTSREFGCGLGQFTVAYNANGTVRFDALSEIREKDKSLEGWSWRNCYEAKYQLRAVVVKLHAEAKACAPLLKGAANVQACTAARYNGGSGSVAKRIRYCRAAKGCNAAEWYGNLELQCPQSKVKAHGYGESFCEINSKYPRRINVRMPKYTEVMK